MAFDLDDGIVGAPSAFCGYRKKSHEGHIWEDEYGDEVWCEGYIKPKPPTPFDYGEFWDEYEGEFYE